MKRPLATVAGVLLLSLASVHCHAQQVCGPRDEILKRLAEAYGEKPVAVGIGPNRLLEIIATENGQTWTAIVIGPDGTACVVMSGGQWEVYQKGRGA